MWQVPGSFDELLDELRTQKPTLQQDLTESILGRLTAPSARLASQLSTDPQVLEARRLALDTAAYDKILEPVPGAKPPARAGGEEVMLFPIS